MRKKRWLQRLMDARTLRIFARLMNGQSLHLANDAMIAATAHNLVVATRNVRDFEPLGIGTFNPFE